MVRISDTFDQDVKLIKILGVLRSDANNFKIIHQKLIPLKDFKAITSRTLTSTNHLIVTFDSSQAILLNLDNFDEILLKELNQEKQPIFVCHEKMFIISDDTWEIHSFVNYFK
jgi:hypothetical protein